MCSREKLRLVKPVAGLPHSAQVPHRCSCLDFVIKIPLPLFFLAGNCLVKRQLFRQVHTMSFPMVPPFSTPSCYSSSNSSGPEQPRPSNFASFASLLPSTGFCSPLFCSDLKPTRSDTMTTPIPLHCNICPKQPDFSDVSHLLTHIASKGHLSHYYKVKVRSSTEPQAAEQIDAYDRWYAEWNVEELMSERMNLKDKKRPRTRLSCELN